jgi:hypothetical protein
VVGQCIYSFPCRAGQALLPVVSPSPGNGYSSTFDRAFASDDSAAGPCPEIDGVPSETVASVLERGT